MVDIVDHVLSLPPQIPPYLSLGAAAAVTMGAAYYMTQGSTSGKVTPLVDPNNQSDILPVSALSYFLLFTR